MTYVWNFPPDRAKTHNWNGLARKLGYDSVEAMLRDLYRIHGTLTAMAKVTGISISTLAQRMDRHNIPRRQGRPKGGGP
jgi:hypothetical protein